MNSFEIAGKVTRIMDVQTFSSGFSKREFILETDDKYPQPIRFECVKERQSLLDRVKVGDSVNVQFRLRGSEYNGKFFVNLQAVGVAVTGAGAGGGDDDRLPPEPEADVESDNGGMPF